MSLKRSHTSSKSAFGGGDAGAKVDRQELYDELKRMAANNETFSPVDIALFRSIDADGHRGIAGVPPLSKLLRDSRNLPGVVGPGEHESHDRGRGWHGLRRRDR